MYNMTSDLGLPSFEQVLEDCKNGANALLICSGGLDSGYILWKYRQAVGNRTINIHHFKLFDSLYRQRNIAQQKALSNQVKYLDCRADITQSTVDTTYQYDLNRHWFIGAFLSATIADLKQLDYIVVGDDLPDSYYRAQPYAKMDKTYQESTMALSNFINSYTKNKTRLCTALETNNLSVAYMEMPEDYRRLLFSCSDPIEHNNFYRACGKCKPCYKNMHFGWWDKIATTVGKT